MALRRGGACSEATQCVEVERDLRGAWVRKRRGRTAWLLVSRMAPAQKCANLGSELVGGLIPHHLNRDFQVQMITQRPFLHADVDLLDPASREGGHRTVSARVLHTTVQLCATCVDAV